MRRLPFFGERLASAFSLQIAIKGRVDERARTAYPCSLRVITQALQGWAGGCKSRIFRRHSLLWVAGCCTVLRSRWYQGGIDFILIFAGHHRSPAPSQIQSVEEREPALPSIQRFDEAPVPSLVTTCTLSSPDPRRAPRILQPSSTVQVSSTTHAELRILSCGWQFESVHSVSWDYLEAPPGIARPITPAVDKVEGDSSGQ